MWCLSSTTVACSTTSSTSFLKTKTPLRPRWRRGSGLLRAAGCSAGRMRRRAGGGSGFCGSRPDVSRQEQTDQQNQNDLFRRRIVSRLGVHPERRQSFGRNQLHFDFTPFAVVGPVLRTVSEHILVAQLDANFSGHVGQVVGIVDGKGAAAGQLGNFSQQRRPRGCPRAWPCSDRRCRWHRSSRSASFTVDLISPSV